MILENYNYEFAEISNKNYVLNFIESLTDEDIAKVFAYIHRLLEIKNLGLRPKPDFSKYISQGIYELKVPLKNTTIRLFYFFKSNKLIIFTSGFVKKTQKLPIIEIEKAIKIKNLYLGEYHD